MRALPPLLLRAAATALLLLGAATAVFFLIHLIPGDPAAAMLGEGAAPSDVEALRHDSRPRPADSGAVRVRIKGLSRGDLGTSILSRKPVAAEVLRAFRRPFLSRSRHSRPGLLVAVPAVSSPLSTAGVLWTRPSDSPPSPVFRHRTTSRVRSSFSSSRSVLGLLPVSGREAPGALVLPAATLGLTVAALLSRMIRASLVDELGKPYVVAARARGRGVSRSRSGAPGGTRFLPSSSWPDFSSGRS